MENQNKSDLLESLNLDPDSHLHENENTGIVQRKRPDFNPDGPCELPVIGENISDNNTTRKDENPSRGLKILDEVLPKNWP